MSCPFTGSKMFWAGPNVLCQTKNLFTYKKFGLAQNILGPVKGVTRHQSYRDQCEAAVSNQERPLHCT